MKKPVVSRTAHPRYTWRVQFTEDGKRKSRFFKAKVDATTFADQQAIEVINHGTELAAIPHSLREEALRCSKLLEPANASLTEAVQFFLKHARPAGGQRVIGDLIKEFLNAKRIAGRRETYLDVQGVVLGGFAKGFDDRNVHEITREEIEKWLEQKAWSLRTRRNVQRDLRNLFGFAVQRGYTASNPALALQEITFDEPPPGILTLAQASSLLNAADGYKRGILLPYVALGLFAGLRTSEIERLDWREIDLAEKTVEIKAEKAKTRARGIVELSDNLVEWLQPFSKRSGAVAPKCPDYHFQEVRKLAGIKKWPKNAMRHSAASYHLALHRNAALTANLLRHENTRTLFAHYRELVKPKDAERYWGIKPGDPSGKVIPISAQAARDRLETALNSDFSGEKSGPHSSP